MHAAIHRLALAALSVLALAEIARADLQPSQVFVVYNRNLSASRELAEYYMKKRGIPAANSIGLDLPKTDDIPREAYLAKLRVPLRGWLRHETLQDKIKCLVTIYGVPLRIAGAGTAAADKPVLKELLAELDSANADLQTLTTEFEKFSQQPPQPAPPGAKPDAQRLLARYETVRDQALARLRSAAPAEQPTLTEQIRPLLQRGEGLQAIISSMQSTDPAGRQVIASLKAQSEKQRAELTEMLAGCPQGPKCGDAHKLLREAYGLPSLTQHLQEDKVRLEGKETHAALDSELSLLWWDDYPLYRWVVSPLCWRTRHAEGFAKLPGADRPTLMVARLDAMTTTLVQRMIDDAIAVEQEGLSGKVYIDARGLPAADSGYGQYDQYLRDLADLLKSKTSLPVVLDNNSDLFGPDTCSDAALYCGWYSLARYVDAFKWNRGAVAFHIASSEAVALHDPGVKYWCKRMLDEGVTATLGPVAEPYLMSFPPPHDFFGLLLTGQYTLAEVYWYTCPFASWMQTLLGDPLYTPFKKHPRLKVEDVFPGEWFNAPATQPTKVASKP